MTSMNGTARLVVSAVVLAVAAVVVVLVLASRPGSAAMVGMDHGSEAVPASTHSPAGSGTSDEMAGMDHGTAHTPESTPTPSMAEDMPGMEHGSGDAAEPGHGTGDSGGSGHGTAERAVADPDRPLAPVLGAFGGGTSAVLLTAGLMRRRDRAADQVKQAARAARRSQR